jgi:hypothetical protein
MSVNAYVSITHYIHTLLPANIALLCFYFGDYKLDSISRLVEIILYLCRSPRIQIATGEAKASQGPIGGEYSSEYLFKLASAWGIETNLSRRKMPLLMALIVKAVVEEAAARGIKELDQLNDEQIAALVPSENTLKRRGPSTCGGRGQKR